LQVSGFLICRNPMRSAVIRTIRPRALDILVEKTPHGGGARQAIEHGVRQFTIMVVSAI
jgi:hypothetical protein